MILQNDELIPTLRAQLKAQLQFISKEIENTPVDSLNFKPSKGNWSVLECIEHLNLVFEWYLPQLKRKVLRKNIKMATSYTTGFFGDRMVNSMEPKDGEIKYPMKTFRNMEPERSKRNKKDVIEQFKTYMNEFDQFIETSKDFDLGSIRIKSAIGNILRFKLGDCYRFLLAHNERHLLQCKKVLRVLATYLSIASRLSFTFQEYRSTLLRSSIGIVRCFDLLRKTKC